jgi:hypothetical protein
MCLGRSRWKTGRGLRSDHDQGFCSQSLTRRARASLRTATPSYRVGVFMRPYRHRARRFRKGNFWDKIGFRRALRTRLLEVPEREDPFAAVIRCTADPARVDKRTRSKWSRVMRYAAVHKDDAEPLKKFVQRKGGINACVARFTKRLGLKRARL